MQGVQPVGLRVRVRSFGRWPVPVPDDPGEVGIGRPSWVRGPGQDVDDSAGEAGCSWWQAVEPPVGVLVPGESQQVQHGLANADADPKVC